MVSEVIILLAFLASTNSEIQTRPDNAVILIGQQFVWPCRIFNNVYPSHVYENAVTWMNERYGIDKIFSGTRILKRLENTFEVEEETTEDYKRVDLKFKNVSYEVTDIYHCVRGHTSRHGYSANIIVADPKSVNCDIFPMNFEKGDFVSVKEGDSMRITCNVEYQTYNNCYAEAVWQGSQGHDLVNYEAKFNNRSFIAHLNIDEDFVNASRYNFSLRFKCIKIWQTQANYSVVEPIFYANYATPTFYLKGEIPVPDPVVPTTTPISFTVHSSASEIDPANKDNEHHSSSMTMTMIFAGILVFFAIIVIILVILFLVKHKKRANDETPTMFTEGQSIMTENVAYKRQPVSCENSYNMHQVNLTPPPQASMGYQGIMSPPAPHSAMPLLHHGLQHYHPAVVFPRKTSAEDSEVYDRIDDNGIISSIYLESTKKPQFTTMPSSSCSSQMPNFASSIIGYIPMTQNRMPAGYHIPSIPSSPAIFHPDPGVYLIPQDSKQESQVANDNK